MKNFVAEVHALAEFCNYDETWNDMLREIIVFEVRDEHIQQHLLAKENLTLQRVLDIAQLMEQVVENAATLRGKDSHQATAVSSFSQGNTDICTNPAFNQVHMLKGKQSYKQQFTPNSKGQRETLPPCFRCAKTGHSPTLCKFKIAKCHHCGKLGHIRPSCKSREKSP